MKLPVSQNARVLVTGGLGFIGRHLCRDLLKRGCHVVALDDLSTGQMPDKRESEKLDIHIGCVTSAEAVRKAAKGCDIVFHLAGVVGMSRVHKEPEWTLYVSVEGTKRVLDAAGDAPVVLFSSSSIYGTAPPIPVAEDDPCLSDDSRFTALGENLYGRGKWEMELMAEAESRRGRRMLIVRPFNVVGVGQSARYGMVIPRFVAQALNGSALTVYDDGCQQRSFCDVETAVSVILKLVDRMDSAKHHVFNVGQESEHSILEIADLVIQAVGRGTIAHIPFQDVYPGFTDVPRRVPDTSRLSDALGEIPWKGLKDVIAEIVKSSRVPVGSGF